MNRYYYFLDDGIIECLLDYKINEGKEHVYLGYWFIFCGMVLDI